MANAAAYSGLRWGEIAALTIAQVSQAARVITVDRKVVEEARAEQEAGSNPLGLVFPSRRGGYWRSSNFNRRVLQPAYAEAGWRSGNGTWRMWGALGVIDSGGQG